jgi:transcriptional regulator
MYIPKANEETRTPVLHELMRNHAFATLVTFGAEGLVATHLPMVLEVDGEDAVLKCHVARGNAQWKSFDQKVPALAIFAGPDHYISPSWYAEKQATGKVVPTWNYAVVHAYGALIVHEDSAWLMPHLESLTDIHEANLRTAGMPKPWKVSDAPEDYVAGLARAIVGLELRITRLEGKWKLSQNRNEADRSGVVAGLDNLETDAAETMKALVHERMKPSS